MSQDEMLPNPIRKDAEAYVERLVEKSAELPSFGGQFDAMFREGVKDLRSTFMETFFGSPETGTEPGVPMNPTPQMVTAELGTLQSAYAAAMEQQQVEPPQVEPPQHDLGHEM